MSPRRRYYTSRSPSMDSHQCCGYHHARYRADHHRNQSKEATPVQRSKQPTKQPSPTPSTSTSKPKNASPTRPDPQAPEPDNSDVESDASSDSMQSMSSPGSPASDIAKPADLSPSDGAKTYLDLVANMASALNVKLTSDAPKVTDVVHDLVHSDLPAGSFLPMLPVHLDAIKEAWDKPASIPPTSKRIESLYKIQATESKFLFSHPAPNSMIVHSSSKSKQTRHPADLMELNHSLPRNWSIPADPFVGLQLLLRFKLLFVPLYCLLVVVACLGNSFLVLCIVADHKLHNATNFFLGNLSVGDLLMCLACVPLTVSYAFEHRGWLFGPTMCHAVVLLQAATVYVSVLSLTAIAVDRYVVVAYPVRRRMALRYCRLVVAAIWVASLALAVPPALHSTYLDLSSIGHELFICEELWDQMETQRLVYSCAMLFISYMVPLLAVTVSYCSILAHLRRRGIPDLASSNQSQWNRQKRKTFILLVVSVLTFAFCWMPLQVLNLVRDLDPNFAILSKRYINVAQVSCHFVAMTSACYNPFIYASLHRKFRAHLRSYFCRGKDGRGESVHADSCNARVRGTTAV
ncbi:prolactin-releasing peptide receptor-like [Heteronotia binoei]|uniref:prolactin-releasing peptide receptor-like n=1 Tax=Heteronotia binoei TaxID=13085 RepID=UPI00292F9112|nr:prolactin-releasing peptide receptor-like [Heteronotia binoei]